MIPLTNVPNPMNDRHLAAVSCSDCHVGMMLCNEGLLFNMLSYDSEKILPREENIIITCDHRAYSEREDQQEFSCKKKTTRVPDKHYSWN